MRTGVGTRTGRASASEREEPPAIQLTDGRELALKEGLVFSNLHDRMILSQHLARPKLGDTYDVCGTDGDDHLGPVREGRWHRTRPAFSTAAISAAWPA